MQSVSCEKINRKRAYSRKVIREAFLELMSSKPMSKITVTEICHFADVNRTTFYSNYNDIYDLVKSIVSELHEKLYSVLAQYDYMDGEAYYTAMLKTIEQNANLCLVLLQLPNHEFKDMGCDFRFPKVMEAHKQRNFHDRGENAVVFEYIVSGTGAVIQNWLADGMKQPISVLAKQLCEINGFLMKSHYK